MEEKNKKWISNKKAIIAIIVILILIITVAYLYDKISLQIAIKKGNISIEPQITEEQNIAMSNARFTKYAGDISGKMAKVLLTEIRQFNTLSNNEKQIVTNINAEEINTNSSYNIKIAGYDDSGYINSIIITEIK